MFSFELMFVVLESLFVSKQFDFEFEFDFVM